MGFGAICSHFWEGGSKRPLTGRHLLGEGDISREPSYSPCQPGPAVVVGGLSPEPGGRELCCQLPGFFLPHLEQVEPASPNCHPVDRLPQGPPRRREL